jgi:hypothetical protein
MKNSLTFILLAIVVIAKAEEYVPGEILTGIPHENLSLPEGETKAPIDEITATPTLIAIFQR